MTRQTAHRVSDSELAQPHSTRMKYHVASVLTSFERGTSSELKNHQRRPSVVGRVIS